MTYFREFPDVEYPSPLPNKKSSLDYVRIKNIFRRVKIREDLQNVFTIFNKYQIPDGARPETVAEEIYGSAEYDWIVLTSANIINVREQWPLSDRDLYRFSENKYGVSGLSEVKFYETIEVRDSKERLVLPAGKIVDPNFKFSYFDAGKNCTNNSLLLNYNKTASKNIAVGANVIEVNTSDYKIEKNDIVLNNNNKILVSDYTTFNDSIIIILSSPISTPISKNDVLSFKRSNVVLVKDPIIGITNYEYEVRKNNKKRSVYLLKPQYLQQYLNDFREIMHYDTSSQYVNNKLIKTENMDIKSP